MTLYIAQSRQQCSEQDVDKKETIYIDDLLYSMTDREIKQNIKILMDVEECTNIDPSIIELNHRKVRSKTLVEHMYLYREIEKILQKEDPEKVITLSIEEQYEPVIHDIIESNSLQSNTKHRRIWEQKEKIKSSVSIMTSLITLIIDYAFSKLLKLVKNDNNNMAKYAIIPKTGRKYKIKPIISKLKEESDIYTTKSAFRCFCSKIFNNNSEHEEKVESMSLYSNSRVIIKSSTYAIQLLSEIWWQRSVQEQILRTIKNKDDINLPNSVEYVCNRHVYKLDIRQELSYYYLVEELHNKRSYSKVIVGGRTPRDSAISVANKNSQVETINIQNTVVPYLFSTPTIPYSKVIMGGKPGMHLWKEYSECDSRIIPDELLGTGYPEHNSYYHDRDREDAINNTISILILTQAHGGKNRRRKFLEGVLVATQNVEPDYEIIIRTHPSESKAVYQDLINMEYVQSNKISFSSSDQLLGDINKSDISIICNTSAGLTSMIAGTPCISYNPWSPKIPCPLYIIEGPASHIESKKSLIRCLSSIDENKIMMMKKNQVDWVDNNYWAKGATQRVIDEISQ